MQEFAKACDAYFIEFGEYPAAVPNGALCRGVTDNPSDPLRLRGRICRISGGNDDGWASRIAF
jgi:hypothetical protein